MNQRLNIFPLEAAYLAGFLEADGGFSLSVSIGKTPNGTNHSDGSRSEGTRLHCTIRPIARVAQHVIRRAVLDRFQTTLGIGAVRGKRNMRYVVAGCDPVEQLIDALYPHLFLKRAAADKMREAIVLLRSCTRKTGMGVCPARGERWMPRETALALVRIATEVNPRLPGERRYTTGRSYERLVALVDQVYDQPIATLRSSHYHHTQKMVNT